jgi:ADP-ribose pyrophosphatase
MKTVLVSAVAMIDADSRVLLAQRPAGKSMAGMWEFPGGKVEAGETPEAALFREIKEELGVALCEPCSYPLTFVSHAYEDFHLLMLLYTCRKWEGIPRPQEGQQLCWKYPHEMPGMPMPPADVPLVAALRDFIS